MVLGFIRFYWALLSFHQFNWASVGFNGFQWVSLGFCVMKPLPPAKGFPVEPFNTTVFTEFTGFFFVKLPPNGIRPAAKVAQLFDPELVVVSKGTLVCVFVSPFCFACSNEK